MTKEETTNMGNDVSVTDLLRAWEAGDTVVGNALFPRVYDQLRKLASTRLWQERSDHTLQPTALVHEAFIRLEGQNEIDWQCREQFIGYAARIMRQVLVDHARARSRVKRGQGWQKVPLTEVDEIARTPAHMLALDEALQWLEERDAGMHQIVELRFFGGLTHQEIGQFLGLSEVTIRRRWRTARAWLHQHLTEGPSDA